LNKFSKLQSLSGISQARAHAGNINCVRGPRFFGGGKTRHLNRNPDADALLAPPAFLMHLEIAVSERGNLLEARQHSSTLLLGFERAHVDGLVLRRG